MARRSPVHGDAGRWRGSEREFAAGVMRRSWICVASGARRRPISARSTLRLRGVVQRMHHFVLDFPYSDVGLVQLMPGENAECACTALRNIQWLGGVPERIVR